MAAVQRRWTAAVAVMVLAVAAVAVMVLAVAASTARGQAVSPAAAPAPAGGIDSACLNSLLNMPDCLPYVQKGSTARRPDKPCCPELAGLVDSNPVCLCELLSGAADSYGIAVDYSRALALPGICHIATPPVSTCAALGYNVHQGPSAAPMSGSPSPSGEGPQFPGIPAACLLTLAECKAQICQETCRKQEFTSWKEAYCSDRFKCCCPP